MKLILFLSLILILVGVSRCDLHVHVDDLDLRVISQLRFEVRNINGQDEQCDLFWRGLRAKLGAYDRGIQIDREEAFEKLRQRMLGRKAYANLLDFVNRCLGSFNTSEVRTESTITEELIEKLEKVNCQLNEQQAESRRLRAEADSLNGKLRNLDEQLIKSSKLQATLSSAEAESKKLKVKLEEKQAEYSKLKAEFDSLKAKANQSNEYLSTGFDGQVVVEVVDMNKAMENDAVSIAKEALQKQKDGKEVATYIKRQFDKKYSGYWQCIVGEKFAHFVHYNRNFFILFRVGRVKILLMKTD